MFKFILSLCFVCVFLDLMTSLNIRESKTRKIK